MKALNNTRILAPVGLLNLFCFQDMAVWSWFFCSIKFDILLSECWLVMDMDRPHWAWTVSKSCDFILPTHLWALAICPQGSIPQFLGWSARVCESAARNSGSSRRRRRGRRRRWRRWRERGEFRQKPREVTGRGCCTMESFPLLRSLCSACSGQTYMADNVKFQVQSHL